MDEQVVGQDLVLQTERDGARGVITIKGELDAYTAPAVEEQIAKLTDAQVTTVVLDLSETVVPRLVRAPGHPHRAPSPRRRRRSPAPGTQ